MAEESSAHRIRSYLEERAHDSQRRLRVARWETGTLSGEGAYRYVQCGAMPKSDRHLCRVLPVMIKNITKKMWRAALEDPDEAHELLTIIKVVRGGSLVSLDYIRLKGKQIKLSEATSEQAHKVVCKMCPDWAKDS